MKTFTQLAWEKKLKPTPKLLLLVLARRAEPGGACTVSTPDLAAEINATPPTVFAGIRELERKGFVVVRRHADTSPNTYILSMGEF